jgi:hypothetical protein
MNKPTDISNPDNNFKQETNDWSNPNKNIKNINQIEQVVNRKEEILKISKEPFIKHMGHGDFKK